MLALTLSLCLTWPPACDEPPLDIMWELPIAESYDPPLPTALTTNARRLVTRPTWHLGIAGHSDGSGAAVTLQLSTTAAP